MEYLKIKDDVQLSELEKFGFKYVNMANGYKVEHWVRNFGEYSYIHIYKKNRRIYILDNRYDEAIPIALFDLIQAGIVECVEVQR